MSNSASDPAKKFLGLIGAVTSLGSGAAAYSAGSASWRSKFQYRIKSEREPYRRIVKELELDPI